MALAPSSPRLPSPPPPAEIQIAPNSPSSGPSASPQATQMEQILLDANSRRRIHPGTKAADMAAGPPLMPLNELDSAFQLQEHLAALHCHLTDGGTKPITRDTAIQLSQPPPGIDRTLWLYELCRFLISQCNSLIVGFLFDTPACSASTCPEMRASEWQFLCAVHEQPKSCCAIDYCCHTLDWAANVVTDQTLFPSRFVVLSDAHNKNVGVKNLVNVFRRLHRIFAHAWFQHRSVFWSIEGQTGLYVFFKTVCDLYDLLPAENYKLPPEAEGIEAPVAEPEQAVRPTPSILKPPSQQRGNDAAGADENLPSADRTNTRRHIRSSPSTGSAVTTVMEAEEEETDGVTQRVRELHISAPDAVAEEPEAADVPMMVEDSVVPGQAIQDREAAGLTPDDLGKSTTTGADQTVVEAEAAPGETPDNADSPALAKDESETTGTHKEEPSTDESHDQPTDAQAQAADTSIEAFVETDTTETDAKPKADEVGSHGDGQ